MPQIRRNGHWIVALLGVAALAWSAGVMAQRTPPRSAPNPENPAEVSRGIASGHELSAAFSHVAKEALPAIVSIEVQGKAMRSVRGFEDLENSPFGDMFRNDPRFREFFRNRPQQRGGEPREAPRMQGMGSGFIIDGAGVVLTNNHVVENADTVRVKLFDGRTYTATEVKTDPKSDVAIIRIKPDSKLHSLKMGNSDATQVGEWVLAVGSPFGLDLSVTAGIISAKGRGPGIADREDFLQTDAAINPGNSGGPLLNLNGEVIGINTAISSRSGGYEGVGFAVPINMAKWVTDQLVASGSVSRAYLGIAMSPVTHEESQKLNVPFGKGVIVQDVLPDTPAAGAKLEVDDIILKLDGKDVHSTREMQSLVEQLKLGGKYPMTVLRKGKEITLTIEAKEMPKDFALRQNRLRGDNSYGDLGLGVEELTAEDAADLGDKNLKGVLVTGVEEDSPAYWANLREGMVITKVGDKEVKSVAEFKAAMKGASVDKGIQLQVRTRRGGSRTLTIQSERSTK